MVTSYRPIKPEWQLLELLCLGPRTLREQEMLEELVRSDCLDWGILLEQALRQKMLPLLAFELTSSQIGEFIPQRVRMHLRTVLDLSRHEIVIFRREAATIVNALDKQGVRCVGTKGIAFESTLYEGNGSRYMADIDFMISFEARDIVTPIMSDFGYETGIFDWQTGKIKPYSRKDIITYQLNPDHLPVFAKLTEDPVIRCVHVDFANSLTWTRSPFDIPVEIALAEISYQPIPNCPDIEMPHFTPIFQFIFTILHLFREAWFEKWLDWEQDVNLIKFGDVVRLWRNNQKILNSEQFVRVLEEFEIMDPVLWVLEHLDRILSVNIVSTLGLEGQVSEDWLASAYAPGGKLRKWKGTMRERLYCTDRRKLFVNTS